MKQLLSGFLFAFGGLEGLVVAVFVLRVIVEIIEWIGVKTIKKIRNRRVK